jgi:hypothetical protein
MVVSIATFILLRNTDMTALRVAVTDIPGAGVSIAVLNFVLRTQESTEFQTVIAWGILSLAFSCLLFQQNNFPNLTKNSERARSHSAPILHAKKPSYSLLVLALKPPHS